MKSPSSSRNSQPRILLAKTGLDGHDRGMKVVAVFLRDAGMDVVYMGIHCATEAIVGAAIDEDVDLIGLSSLGGAHIAYTRELISQLAHSDRADIAVVVGGTIPVEDIPTLESMGVRAVIRPGTPREEIVSTISTIVAQVRSTRVTAE